MALITTLALAGSACTPEPTQPTTLRPRTQATATPDQTPTQNHPPTPTPTDRPTTPTTTRKPVTPTPTNTPTYIIIPTQTREGRNAKTTVTRINPDGTQPTTLIDNYSESVDISPDSQHILATSWHPYTQTDNKIGLNLYTINGKYIRRLIDTTYPQATRFSPDGTLIALLDDRQLWITTTTPDPTKPSTTLIADNIDGYGWAPDSKHLATHQFNKITIRDLTGTPLRTLPNPNNLDITESCLSGYPLAWTPATNEIAYPALDDQTFGIYASHANATTPPRLLTAHMKRDMFSCQGTWSKDGQTLSYWTHYHPLPGPPEYQICIVTTKGNDGRCLATVHEPILGDWADNKIYYSADTELTIQDGPEKDQLWSIDLNGKTTQLTHYTGDTSVHRPRAPRPPALHDTPTRVSP